jgi:hypothetical protein
MTRQKLWDCIGSLDMLGYEEMKSLTDLQRMVLFRNLSGLSHPWGSLHRTLKRRQNAIWLTSIWQCDMVLVVLRDTLENILALSPTIKTRFLSFNRTQSRFVTGLLTGHNTLRRHLYLMGLTNNPLSRRCGAERENSVHILHECEASASLRCAYLVFFFLDPEDIKSLEAIWNF